MSSEMRKISEAWKLSAKQFSELGSDIGMIEAAVYSNCAKEIDALLARTEAGADGDGFLGFVHECVWEDGTSRTIYEKQPSLLRERPGLTSQRIVRAYTHPQDASGDAERTKGLLLALIQIRDSTYRNATQLRGMANDALERDRTRPVTAMQAKEAK